MGARVVRASPRGHLLREGPGGGQPNRRLRSGHHRGPERHRPPVDRGLGAGAASDHGRGRSLPHRQASLQTEARPAPEKPQPERPDLRTAEGHSGGCRAATRLARSAWSTRSGCVRWVLVREWRASTDEKANAAYQDEWRAEAVQIHEEYVDLAIAHSDFRDVMDRDELSLNEVRQTADALLMWSSKLLAGHQGAWLPDPRGLVRLGCRASCAAPGTVAAGGRVASAARPHRGRARRSTRSSATCYGLAGGPPLTFFSCLRGSCRRRPVRRAVADARFRPAGPPPADRFRGTLFVNTRGGVTQTSRDQIREADLPGLR